jgi:hypothetical protein
MKKIIQYASGLLIICLLSATVVSAQETKKENKIKIIVDDGSGKKIIIDTVITDVAGKDPVIVKDGKVIVFSTPGEITHSRSGSGKQEVIVNVEAEGDNSGDITKTITIINADSLKSHSNGKEKVMIVTSDAHEGNGKATTHYAITRSGHPEKAGKGNVYFYSNDDNNTESGNNEIFEVRVDTGDRDEMPDTKVRYVVAKNGMVVTIEGNDEAKAKELFNEIEKKLDEGNSAKVKKEVSKTTTSKPVKK